MEQSIFHDPIFTQSFHNQISISSWNCGFPNDVLLKSVKSDSKLCVQSSKLKARRRLVQEWMDNDSQWSHLILEACNELSGRRQGPFAPCCKVLKDLHILKAFSDFVEHLNFFYAVAFKMSAQGEVVKPKGHNSSSIHDIDKLDPVMLVGYSEMLEDHVPTSLWKLCLEKHVTANPHHQAHKIWHCGDVEEEEGETRAEAMKEMVCDKVSKRVQRSLNGTMSEDMWNVKPRFFFGLPDQWMFEANGIIQRMKPGAKAAMTDASE